MIILPRRLTAKLGESPRAISLHEKHAYNKAGSWRLRVRLARPHETALNYSGDVDDQAVQAKNAATITGSALRGNQQ